MMESLVIGENRFIEKVFAPETIDQIRRVSRLQEPFLDASNCESRPDALADVEIIFGTWGMPVLNRKFLSLAPKLRAVFYAAGTVKSFVTDDTWKRGVTICSAWRANALPVAEFTLGAILLSMKNVWAYHRNLKVSRNWAEHIPTRGGYHGTIGLISLGAVGMRVAELLAGFEMDVIAYDPVVDPNRIKNKAVKLVGIEELFERSDVVSIHAPWLKETEGMVNGPLMRRMKPHATLINTARGAVLDETALLQVMKERPDLTALLDVTHDEPPSADCPLFDVPNILITPHVSGSIGGECERMGKFMVGEYLRFLRKEPLEHQITPSMLFSMA